MKKIITICAAILMTASVFLPQQASAQAPEKVSYQAVVRDASNNLVSSTAVGMQISILQGSSSGTAVYVETQEPSTNANGLVSIEIGTGTSSDDFTTIDWASGPYFIKTETDPSGGTNFTITSTSQLLSVPYAMHAKTAETLSGGINETDPVFAAWDKSTGIFINESQISDFGNYVETESDPEYLASEAANITATDITNLGNLSGTNTGDQDISGIATNTQSIQDTASQIRSDIPDVSGFLTSETDPSVPAGTQTGEMQYWNGSEWIAVEPGISGEVLVFINEKPTWGIQGMEDGDVYNPSTGKIWMDSNLGALQVAISSTDAASYGDLYQWGRAADGHESRTSGIIATLSSTDNPGHSDFITPGSSPFDWRSTQNDNLWQGASGTNNPCPSGYRLPTEAEWEDERTSWSSNNPAGAFASPLKLPVAGRRSSSSGSLQDVGSVGDYWSGTVDGANSRSLYFGSSSALMYSNVRASGNSVRCIKD